MQAETKSSLVRTELKIYVKFRRHIRKWWKGRDQHLNNLLTNRRMGQAVKRSELSTSGLQFLSRKYSVTTWVEGLDRRDTVRNDGTISCPGLIPTRQDASQSISNIGFPFITINGWDKKNFYIYPAIHYLTLSHNFDPIALTWTLNRWWEVGATLSLPWMLIHFL